MLSFVGDQVRQFLSSFVTDHIFGTVLVWPARIVVSHLITMVFSGRNS